MVTMKELIQGISEANPEFAVEREGKTNKINIYTQDKKLGKLGICCVIPGDSLKHFDTSICSKLAGILQASFARVTQLGEIR